MADLPPPGWHPDPNGSGRWRWWNGGEWTAHFSPASRQKLTTSRKLSVAGDLFRILALLLFLAFWVPVAYLILATVLR